MATVLIVEDEDQVRVLAESYLREQGHQTVSAATAEEALAVFEVVARIDVLFIDVNLRGDIHAGLEVGQTRAGAPTGPRRPLHHRPRGHRRHAGDDGRELRRAREALHRRSVADRAFGAFQHRAAKSAVAGGAFRAFGQYLACRHNMPGGTPLAAAR